MNTVQIEYYIALCKTLNYSKAAENLNISQPTLSKAIRHLENELGFPLFHKVGRSITLTEQSLYFLPQATQAMELLNHAIDEAILMKHIINIGCISSVQLDYLPLIIDEYSKQSTVQFNIRIDTSDGLLGALRNHDIDIAICTAPEHSSDINSFPVVHQPLMVCVHPNNPLANQTSLTMEQIKNEKLISHGQASAMRKIVKSLYDGYHITPTIVAEAVEDNSIIALVKRNLGIGVVTQSSSLITDGVVLIPIEQNIVQRNVSLCYRKDEIRNQRFISWIQKNHAI